MEINIAVIECEMSYYIELKKILKNWASFRKCVVNIFYFSTMKEFTSKNLFQYDLLFLEINLNNCNYINEIKNLRKNGLSVNIIFISQYKNFVFDAFDVNALYYIFKPINYQTIVKCMNKVYRLMLPSNFIFYFRNDIYILKLKDIIYLSSYNHYIDIHTNKKIYSYKSKLKDVKDKLLYPFIQCHRSIILNVNYIEKISKHSITLTNSEIIPISNTYIDNIKNSILYNTKNNIISN